MCNKRLEVLVFLRILRKNDLLHVTLFFLPVFILDEKPLNFLESGKYVPEMRYHYLGYIIYLSNKIALNIKFYKHSYDKKELFSL